MTVLTLLHSEQPKLHRVWTVLSAIGLMRGQIYVSKLSDKIVPRQFQHVMMEDQGIISELPGVNPLVSSSVTWPQQL